jgi:hypothetical protein
MGGTHAPRDERPIAAAWLWLWPRLPLASSEPHPLGKMSNPAFFLPFIYPAGVLGRCGPAMAEGHVRLGHTPAIMFARCEGGRVTKRKSRRSTPQPEEGWYFCQAKASGWDLCKQEQLNRNQLSQSAYLSACCGARDAGKEDKYSNICGKLWSSGHPGQQIPSFLTASV